MCRSTGSSTRAARCTQPTNVPRASSHPQPVGQHLLHPAQGQMLLLHQIDRQRPHARAVLRPGGRLGGERADADGRTGRAAHVQRPLLAHHQTHHGGQLVHLAPLVEHHRGVAERRPALRTDGGPMLDHLLGHRHQVPRLAPVAQLSRLPARFLAAPLAQALRLAPEPVAAGRFGAVVAIRGQPGFQLLHTRQQRDVLLAQALILGFEVGNPLVGRSGKEATSLPPPPLRTVRATFTAHGSISPSVVGSLRVLGPLQVRQGSVCEHGARTQLVPLIRARSSVG
jgi:hypothetical protein